MLRLVALTLVATASSQELTSQEGTIVARSANGVRQVRQQEVNSFELSQLVESQASDISTLREMVSTMMGPQSPITAAVQVIAADMTDRTMGLMSTATENAVNLASVTTNLNGLTSAVDTQLAAAATATRLAAAAQAATLSNTVATMNSTLTATVDTMTGTMDSRINGVLASLASTATVLRTSQTSGASTLTASVNVQLRRVNTSLATVTAGLAGKRSAASHLWVGSCSNYGNGGWREYCYNRIEVDSARPMFRKESNVRMRSIAAGYYMQHFHRMLQTCNWSQTLLYFNGSHRIHSHNFQGENSHWHDDKVTMTYPLAANQQFWARVWNGCWTNWHTSVSHTKFHAMYMGAIPA